MHQFTNNQFGWFQPQHVFIQYQPPFQSPFNSSQPLFQSAPKQSAGRSARKPSSHPQRIVLQSQPIVPQPQPTIHHHKEKELIHNPEHIFSGGFIDENEHKHTIGRDQKIYTKIVNGEVQRLSYEIDGKHGTYHGMTNNRLISGELLKNNRNAYLRYRADLLNAEAIQFLDAKYSISSDEMLQNSHHEHSHFKSTYSIKELKDKFKGLFVSIKSKIHHEYKDFLEHWVNKGGILDMERNIERIINHDDKVKGIDDYFNSLQSIIDTIATRGGQKLQKMTQRDVPHLNDLIEDEKNRGVALMD